VTVLEVIQRSAGFLGRRGVESPRLQIELLLAHVLRMPRLNLYLSFDRVLNPVELDAVRELVARRGAREPLQYLLGATSFCGLEMQVTPDVLIPRPETELLAERAWTWLKARRASAAGESSPTVLDFGTGSGCLAITIAVKCPQARVWAVDISPPAIEIARRNAFRHRVLDRLQLVCGDGFAALPAGARFDLMVANPPYIPTPEIASLQPEVRDHEPRLALDGGADGLDFLRRLASEGRGLLPPDGCLLVEVGDGQAGTAGRLFAPPAWATPSVAPDDTGRARILIAHPGGS
jgi:release factor glutamine methyltransferase